MKYLQIHITGVVPYLGRQGGEGDEGQVLSLLREVGVAHGESQNLNRKKCLFKNDSKMFKTEKLAQEF